MLKKFSPFDLIALVVVLGYLCLVFYGKGERLEVPFNAILSFYFGFKVNSAAQAVLRENELVDRLK
jgi:hypothetical protein